MRSKELGSRGGYVYILGRAGTSMRQALLSGTKLKRVPKNSVIKVMFQCNLFTSQCKKIHEEQNIKILKIGFNRIRAREVRLG